MSKMVDDVPADIKQWTSQEIRAKFVEFFEHPENFPNHPQAGLVHTNWKSSPVVPHNDPTLLFINAGMNQFKKVFTQEEDPTTAMGKLVRAVNSQKCIRAGGKHNDLDDVGKDVYHHTFFEMLGNWSFGDYFKKEAIEMAWFILTEVYQIPKSRLYVSYYGGDPKQPDVGPDLETKQLWLDLGVEEERILPFDMADNFWEMGDSGPCGPCTEIHYDRIGGRSVPELVNMDDPDVLEIWNLVFMQFYRGADGSLANLPKGSVDTGLGLERLVSCIQGYSSNYDTDLFTPIFKTLFEKSNFAETSGRPYSGLVGDDDVDGIDMAYRVLADHIRTLSISIADGASPSNEGRGYVLRRVLRRAIRFGRQFLNAPKKPWFFECVDIVADIFNDVFPEVMANKDKIKEIIKDEEISFLKTLDKGTALFRAKSLKVKASDTPTIFPGEVAFDLYTRCGFPTDLVQLMAEEEGMEVDTEAYDQSFLKHRLASALGAKFKKGGNFIVKPDKLDVLKNEMKVAPTKETGKYDWTPAEEDGVQLETQIAAIFDANTDAFIEETVDSSQVVGVVLTECNFYAEGGGQVGDVGTLQVGEQTLFTIQDTKKVSDYIFCIGVVEDGQTLKRSMAVTTDVDYVSRANTARNHTGTHVLNHALRATLGGKCDQKGSVVDPLRLRFDFEFNRGLTEAEILAIEAHVAGVIGEEKNVNTDEVSLQDAMKINGLRAVAGDAYPDPVRMVTVGVTPKECISAPESEKAVETSVEFCGGTHLHNTSEMQKMIVIGEEALAKGIRRITCFTGDAAANAQARGSALKTRISAESAATELPVLERALNELRAALKEQGSEIGICDKKQCQTDIDAIAQRVLNMQKELQKARAKEADVIAEELLAKVAAESPKFLVVMDVNYDGAPTRMNGDPKAMDVIIKKLYGKKNDAPTATPIMILSSQGKGTVAIQVQVPKAASAGFPALEWGTAITEVIGGKCGGKAEMARGMVKDAEFKEGCDLNALAEKFAAAKLE